MSLLMANSADIFLGRVYIVFRLTVIADGRPQRRGLYPYIYINILHVSDYFRGTYSPLDRINPYKPTTYIT